MPDAREDHVRLEAHPSPAFDVKNGSWGTPAEVMMTMMMMMN